MELERLLEKYRPYNEQEARDLALMKELQKDGRDYYVRETAAAHLTASAWVVTPDKRKVLMAYHNIYNSWAWLGGHADGDRDLMAVAVREAREEAGLLFVKPVSDMPLSVEILPVSGHEKKGIYVPSHLHLNVTWLLEADENQALTKKEDENSGVAWFIPEEALSSSSEPWMRERIYKKLVDKVKKGDY